MLHLCSTFSTGGTLTERLKKDLKCIIQLADFILDLGKHGMRLGQLNSTIKPLQRPGQVFNTTRFEVAHQTTQGVGGPF